MTTAGRREVYSAEQGGAAGLDGLDLGEVDGGPAEAGGQVVPVEEDALGGLDGAHLVAGHHAHARGAAGGLAQGAVLLGVVAVAAEGIVRVAAGGAAALAEVSGQRPGRGLRVRMGGVVDVGCGGDMTC